MVDLVNQPTKLMRNKNQLVDVECSYIIYYTSGNHTPGSRSYIDLVDIWPVSIGSTSS